MTYSPELRGIVTYEFKKLGGNLSFNYKYNGELPIYSVTDDGRTTQGFSEPYQMLDIASSKYFIKKQLVWTFGLKNLLDVQNINTSSTSGGIHSSGGGIIPVAWGRTFFTSLRFNIGWK